MADQTTVHQMAALFTRNPDVMEGWETIALSHARAMLAPYHHDQTVADAIALIDHIVAQRTQQVRSA